MNESAWLRHVRAFGRFALMIGLALTCGVNCSSVSRNYDKETLGGSGGLAGSSGDVNGGTSGNGASGGSTGTGGQSGSTALGGAGNADCSAGALLAPDLHAACIEDLGQGTLRFHYDFANAEQGLDWVPSTDTSVTVNQRALVIVTPSNNVGVAIFKKKLHVNRASFRVSLLSGNTTNWYINTIWSGSWNPDAGYGGYHDYTGRGFIINGTKYNPADVSPLSVGDMHDFTVEQSDTELLWDDGGTVMTEAIGPLPVTDRSFALGAWQSSAAFYSIVFEGTLN